MTKMKKKQAPSSGHVDASSLKRCVGRIIALSIVGFFSTSSYAFSLIDLPPTASGTSRSSPAPPGVVHRMVQRGSLEINNVGDIDSTSSKTIQAASDLAKQTCSFLGIKSVGVDYGTVRTGLGVTIGYSPRPIDIVSGLNNTELCEEVIRVGQVEKAERLIVGLPLHKNGTESEQANVTRIFASELAALTLERLGPNTKVYLWDERYTSKEAAARAHSKDPGRYLYGSLDAESACLILENYYNDDGIGAELVSPPLGRVDQLTHQWELQEVSRQEALLAASNERDEKLQWRKRQMMLDTQKELEEGSVVAKAKKKKRKKKK